MTQSQIERGALSQELAQVRFSQLYRAEAAAISAYTLRRARDPEDAADAAAETFLVAWRRLAEVPIGGSERLWLYGVARRVLANQSRAERRRSRLGERLAEALRTELATHPGPTAEGAELLRATSKLPEEDRELLLLVSWEGLSPSEAARVIGISPLAARSRLHRARRRLRTAVEQSEEPAMPNSELDREAAQ